MGIFVEAWPATFGAPYLVPPDDPGSATAVLIEDGATLSSHTAERAERYDGAIAFVDGVRRGEAYLYQHDPATGAIARGVAGGHACGAVIGRNGVGAEFDETRIRRLVIWGSGLVGDLPAVAGGWSWQSVSIADPSPDAPLRELQTRMRQEEGRLAEALCDKRCLVLIDGPLNFLRSRDLPVVGYVKTHHRALLALEHHVRFPNFAQVSAHHFSGWGRIGTPATFASPRQARPPARSRESSGSKSRSRPDWGRRRRWQASRRAGFLDSRAS